MVAEWQVFQSDTARLLDLVKQGIVSIEDATNTMSNYHTDEVHIELVENESQLRSRAEHRLYNVGWRKKIKES